MHESQPQIASTLTRGHRSGAALIDLIEERITAYGVRARLIREI
jgi:hypothetical protein